MRYIVCLAVLLFGGLFASVGSSAGKELPPVFTVYLPLVVADEGTTVLDMNRFITGDSRLYEVRHSSGSQARHQTQYSGDRFYHTKGNEFKAEWEELWIANDIVYRGTDTSPGNGQYYTLYDSDVAGSAWAPRYWRIGDLYERNPLVVFYRKSDCGVVLSGTQRSWLRLVAYHPTYTFGSGITLNNVVELAWLPTPDGAPIENYFYAENYGLVGWGSNDRGLSYISEIHAPGQRPNNKREVIGCMSRSGRLPPLPSLSFAPLPREYWVK